MIKRTTRLRWRRRFRRSRKQVEGMGTQAEERLERHFFRRMGRLLRVRRFISTWIVLVMLLLSLSILQIRNLGGYYLVSKPVPGGAYVEGELGTFTNANPLFATTAVDSSVSRLLFASLFKYDQNHNLVGDLADHWTVDDRGVTYTVSLKHDLKWQDDYPLTANDVDFTYKTIQNPDVKSPLFGSWRGITVTVKNPWTIEFVLPSALGSFPYSMTNGIIPKHLLSTTPATQLRSVSFNTVSPVGAGPFKWSAIEVIGQTPETHEQRIALLPNEFYHGGKPKLNKFIVRSFQTKAPLTKSFMKHELNGVAGLGVMPKKLLKDPGIKEYNIPLLGEVMIFLRTSSDVLIDPLLRQALERGTDTSAILKVLGYPVIAAHEPLLAGQLAYDKSLAQSPYDTKEAAKLFEQAGWKLNAKGIREKNGKPLVLSLYAPDTDEYQVVTTTVQQQWRQLGVTLTVNVQSEAELQTTLAINGYDTLLYGIGIGVDPDVFAYWHSSQASTLVPNHLNFSDYKSAPADRALEAGRTRVDPTIRTVKYQPFLEAWRSDVPAIALYQPRFLYITRGQLYNFETHAMVAGTDRFANVENWMIRENRQSQ